MVQARQHAVEAGQTLAAAQQAKTTADQEFTTASGDADLAVQQLIDQERGNEDILPA
jgi:hypothetical protein